MAVAVVNLEVVGIMVVGVIEVIGEDEVGGVNIGVEAEGEEEGVCR